MPPFARNLLSGLIARFSLSNKAKQVAPEPDIRVKIAPGRVPSQLKTVSICGTSALAAQFQVVPALAPVAKGSAVDPVPAAKTSPVKRGTRGFTRSTGKPERSDRSTGVRRSPAPSPRIGKLSRQAGTSLPSWGATLCGIAGSSAEGSEQPQCCGSIGGSASKPRATGKLFSRIKFAAALDPSGFLIAHQQRKHEIVGAVQLASERPCNRRDHPIGSSTSGRRHRCKMRTRSRSSAARPGSLPRT